MTNILNAVAHLQIEFDKSSRDLLKPPTNKNISVRECIFLGIQTIFAQIGSCFPI